MLPEAKSSVEWVDADTLPAFERPWRRHGDSFRLCQNRPAMAARRAVDRAPVIFETSADHMARTLQRRRHRADAADMVRRSDRFLQFRHLWLSDEAGRRSEARPADRRLAASTSRLVCRQAAYGLDGGGQDLCAGHACSASSLSAFLAGDRNFTVVFEPGPRRALQGFFWAAGKLVLSILDELRPVFEVCTPSANGWTPREVAGTARDRRGRCLASRPSRSRRATATCSPMSRIR